MRDVDALHLIALLRHEGFTAPVLQQLLERHASLSAAFVLDRRRLVMAGMRERHAAAFIASRTTPDITTEAAILASEDITAIPFDDPRYPPSLKGLPDLPPALFVRGDIRCLTERICIAIVGTRRITPYGGRCTRHIVRALTGTPTTIVSGLAFGADIIAHTTALACGIPTVAVLASSVEKNLLGPRANAHVAERMIGAGGAVISEYPPGIRADKRRFPMRNRIIAGVCQTTVIVQAPRTSGALHTARAALEYGRDVLAVPGPIDDRQCDGSNRLIADGACPVCDPDEIAGHLGCAADAAQVPLSAGPEKDVLESVKERPRTLDEIVELSGHSMGEILEAITSLELSGRLGKTGDLYAVN